MGAGNQVLSEREKGGKEIYATFFFLFQRELRIARPYADIFFLGSNYSLVISRDFFFLFVLFSFFYIHVALLI